MPHVVDESGLVVTASAVHVNRTLECFREQVSTIDTENRISEVNLRLNHVNNVKMPIVDNVVETSNEASAGRNVEINNLDSCGSVMLRSHAQIVEVADSIELPSNTIESSECRDVAMETPALVDAAVQSFVDDDLCTEVSVKQEIESELTGIQESEINAKQRCFTLNLPLEVIGACWFMRKDSENCLQAVTSTEDEIRIRLAKKDSRVVLTFEANTPTGKSFEQVLNGCRCHVESLLEPSKKSPPIEDTLLSSSSHLTLHNDNNNIRFKSTDPKVPVANCCNAVTVANVVSSRLRPRPTGGVHYEDSDEEEDQAPVVNHDAIENINGNIRTDEDDKAEAEDLDSFGESDDMEIGLGDGNSDEKEDLQEEESESEDEDQLPPKKIATLSVNPNNKFKQLKKSSNIVIETDSGEDCEWMPSDDSKCTKLSRSGIRLKVKIKSEPEVNEDRDLYEEEVRRVTASDKAESEETDPEDAEEEEECDEEDEPVVARTRGQYLTSKPKRGMHKQTNSEKVNIANKVRRLKTKGGPKWEKKGNCPHCGVFYGNLSQHIGLYCPKNPNRQRAYHCCYCKFRSLDRASLAEHKATHVLARDFKCEICDSSFFTRQRLVRHMRYVHLLGTNPVRIYTCDRCGKRFRYHSHYDRHLTIHSEEKSAQCDKCGKFFKNSHNVRNHQSRMHPGKPESFPFYCDKCGQGTHSLTGHRCVVPGEMHGSRRRRAPRSGPSGSTTVGDECSVDASELSPIAAMSSAPLLSSPNNSVRNRGKRRPVNVAAAANSDVVDSRLFSETVSECSDYRSSGLPTPADNSIESSVDSRRSSSLASPSQHADQYSSMVSTGANLSFGPCTVAHQLVDRHLSAGIRSSYSHRHLQQQQQQQPDHHHPVTVPGVDTSPYDRRALSSLEHHIPAVAHQALQHQPPYSNLLAVDPFLHAQLRAANMMYRMDY